MSLHAIQKELSRHADEFLGLDPRILAEMIVRTDGEIVRAGHNASEARRVGDQAAWRQYRNQARRATGIQKALMRRMALDFGISRGWRLSATTFGLRTLERGKQHSGGMRGHDPGNGVWSGNDNYHNCFDHPYYYRVGRKAAAIAAHLYDWPMVKPQCETMAAEYGLRFEQSEFPSWWNPGSTILVVYVGPAGLVGS